MRTAIALLALCGMSSAGQQVDFQPERCKVFFSIAWRDMGAGISDRLWEESEALAQSENQATDTNKNWLPKNADKKYPELCYSRVAANLRLVVRHNAHYSAQESTTRSSPVTGTVTDSDYNRSTVTGTVTETVPVVASYAYTTLAIEAKVPDGTWKELRSFGRQGHCHMSYGNCIADGDLVRPLFKDALKWLHGNPP